MLILPLIHPFLANFRVKHLKIEISQHYLFPSTTRLSSSIDAGIITGNKSYRTIHDFISASLSDIKYSHALGSDGRSKVIIQFFSNAFFHVWSFLFCQSFVLFILSMPRYKYWYGYRYMTLIPEEGNQGYGSLFLKI